MSRRANPALIGGFVLGALALLIAGLLVLGAGRFGGDREIFVLYFRDSTSGLKVGAPVVLKGVQIGVVKDIEVAYDEASGQFLVRVHIEIDQDRVQWPGEIRGELDSQELYQKALAAGLRARLGLQSLVTGMLQVEAGFFPGTELNLHGGDTRYRELPTIRSPFDRLQDQLETIPVENLVAKSLDVLEGLNRLLSSPELQSILAKLDSGVSSFALAAAQVRERVEPTGDRLDAALDGLGGLARTLETKLDGLLISLEAAAANVRKLAQSSSAEIGPTAESLRKAGDSATSAFVSADRAFGAVAAAVDDRSALYRDTLAALRSLSTAARSFRDLADYLERHPEALIRGKYRQ